MPSCTLLRSTLARGPRRSLPHFSPRSRPSGSRIRPTPPSSWSGGRAIEQGRRRPAARSLSGAETPQPLHGFGRSQLARPLIPLARSLNIGLQTHDVQLGELVGVVGSRERHRTLRKSHFDRALEEL